MIEPPADAKYILGINDLRGTPLVDGKPSDVFGIGLMIGFADAGSLGIPELDPDKLGSLAVNAQADDETGIDCITREFTHKTVKYVQRAESGDAWGPWESQDWDHEAYARLHREQKFTEPQHFGKAIFEQVQDLGEGSAIDIRQAAVFKKVITVPTAFTITSDYAEQLEDYPGGMASFSLHLENGGVEEVTWWEGLKWTDGEPPELTVSGIDLLGFITIDGGQTWLGVILGQNYK